MTMRCSLHGISYPPSMTECLVCRAEGLPAKLDGIQDPYDENWNDLVKAALAPPAELEDKVPKWRWSQLMSAGYSPRQSSTMALRRDIDLHQAVDLAEKAGSDVAYTILI
jgi:hypothetical protein